MVMPGETSDAAEQRFRELDALRLTLETNLESVRATLDQYRDEPTGGWYHLHPEVAKKTPGDFSRASTATCLALDRAARLEMVTRDQAQTLFNAIADSREPWTSAELPGDNAFTISFLLEALADLLALGARMSRAQRTRVASKVGILLRSFEAHKEVADRGGIAVPPYPPVAFLTYKAIHALLAWERVPGTFAVLTPELRASISRWLWASLNAESVAVSGRTHNADVFELAYAVLAAVTLTDLDKMTPPQRGVLGHALSQFFAAQSEDGTWPRSRPLFHYPRYGDAYCYEYELLVSLLSNARLRPMLRAHITALSKATRALEHLRFPVGNGFGWSSGHLRQVKSAESWSTASVFHYCFELASLVSLEIRQLVFQDLGAQVPPPVREPTGVVDSSKFLDSRVVLPGQRPKSLTKVINERFLGPLFAARETATRGNPFPDTVPTAAILYGPPGTSKTELAKLIAEALGWPLLKIDPSHLTRSGLDRIHAEANRVFGMLEAADQTVVLLDEFDELVREREGPNEVVSRFLTTAMLPKLTALHDRRRIVVLVATNHLESFDSAIRRPGRFDMIVPVMQPTLEAKLARWPAVATRMGQLGIDLNDFKYASLKEHLDSLTFAEFKAVASKLVDAKTDEQMVKSASDAFAMGTLAQPLPKEKINEKDTETWAERVHGQKEKIRLP